MNRNNTKLEFAKKPTFSKTVFGESDIQDMVIAISCINLGDD